MNFKPKTWRPIAIVLAVVNVAAAGFAAAAAQPLHASVHAALALAFGVWAQRLQQGPTMIAADESRLEAIEGEMDNLRKELNETQERLNFVERVLAGGAEGGRQGIRG